METIMEKNQIERWIQKKASELTVKDKTIIRREQTKLDQKLVDSLKKIQKTGFLPKKKKAYLEMLLLNDFIRIGSPRDTIQYNCFHITEEGQKELKRAKDFLKEIKETI